MSQYETQKSQRLFDFFSALRKVGVLCGVLSALTSHASIETPMLCRTPASIDRAEVMSVKPTKIISDNKGEVLNPELIATYFQIKATEKPMDIEKMIPLDMVPTENSAAVFSQVADKSLTNFFNSPEVRETYLGRTATTVEKNLKKEIVVGSSEGLQHRFSFNVQAFQALAQMQYTGFTNAAVKYKANESKIALEVFEKIQGTKDLVLSHSISPLDRVSQLSLRWNY